MTTAHDRKQQERQARRRRIQRAARTVFAEKGYAKTSIEQIAREASLSVGAIYLYFRSKEDLYVSLLEETLELFDTELGRIRSSEASPNEKLRDAWSFLSQWATTDVEATRVLRLLSQPNVRKQLSDEVAASVGKGITVVRDHLGAMIEEGISSGAYPQSSVAEAVDLMWALFLGALQASDAHRNLELPGCNFADLSRTAQLALEAALRAGATRVAAEAA